MSVFCGFMWCMKRRLLSLVHLAIHMRWPALPGWHGVELRYSKSPLDETSVFKFFVIDAEQVETVYNSGVPSNQILWKVSLMT